MTKYLGLNISDEIAEAIEKRLEETGQSKTDFVTELLSRELGIPNHPKTLSGRVDRMEIQITEISDRLKALESNAIATPQSSEHDI